MLIGSDKPNSLEAVGVLAKPARNIITWPGADVAYVAVTSGGPAEPAADTATLRS